MEIKLGCWGTEKEPGFQEFSDPGQCDMKGRRKRVQGPDQRGSQESV